MILNEQTPAQLQRIKKFEKQGYAKTTAADYASKKSGKEYVTVDNIWWGVKNKTNSEPAEPEDGNDDKKPWEKIKLPFKDTTESDAFRAWLLAKHSRYESLGTVDGKDMSVAKAPSSTKSSNALKNAYYDKGDEYVKWVSAGGKVEKVDAKTFKVIDGSGQPVVSAGGNVVGGNSGGSVIDDVQTIKRQGCNSIGNKSKFLGLGTTDETRNDYMRSFLMWWKKTFNKTYFVPNGTCGMYPAASPDMWIYNKLYDENGKTYYAWSDENLNKLAEYKEDVNGEETSYFDMWLKYRENLPTNTKKNNNTTTKGTTDKKEAEDVKNTNRLKFAADIINKDKQVLRKNCANLSNVLNSFDYDYGDKDINTQIEKCQKQYNRLMTKVKKESIENKIIGKLKLMKENKQLIGKVSDKLKTKKLEKITENFFKQNYRKFFDTYSKYVKSNNMISEATNSEFEKSFDVIFQGKESEFKNRAIEYILGKLEVSPSSELGKSIKSELDRVPAKDIFRYESAVPEAVSKAVETSSPSNNGEQPVLKRIVSQAIKFDDKEIKQGVRQHLHDYIEGVKDDIKSLEQKLKSSIVKSL